MPADSPGSKRRMVRARFRTNADDYRPVKWPPPGPYWCTGYGMHHDFTKGESVYAHAIVVAYANDENQIREYWPDATDIIVQLCENYTFTDRFPKPHWFAKLEGATTG